MKQPADQHRLSYTVFMYLIINVIFTKTCFSIESWMADVLATSDFIFNCDA